MLKDFRNSIIYNDAVNYASYIHKNEMRKGTNEPYVFHPIRVSKLVERYMEDDKDVENYIIAAILHDTVEAEYDKKEEVLGYIEKRFGSKIKNIVENLTNEKISLDILGKEEYLALKMKNLEDKDLILKLCDRLDNVSSLKDASYSFNDKYTRETIYIINELLLSRDLNPTQLEIMNKIMTELKEVSFNKSALLDLRKIIDK